MDFHASALLKVSKMKDFPSLSDPTVTIMLSSEDGVVQQDTGGGRHKHGLMSNHVLHPGDLALAIAATVPATVAEVDGPGGEQPHPSPLRPDSACQPDART